MDDVLIIRRLSLPRFLFREAKAALQRPGPYSGGMATSLFQDSVEAFLRILAEHGSVNIGASVPFDKLLDKVGAKFNSVLEHRAVITRLNKARVNFKHHGQRIVNEEALSFAHNVEAFLTEVSSDVLQLESHWCPQLAIGAPRTGYIKQRGSPEKAATAVCDVRR